MCEIDDKFEGMPRLQNRNTILRRTNLRQIYVSSNKRLGRIRRLQIR